jgi:hypothetical protein
MDSGGNQRIQKQGSKLFAGEFQHQVAHVLREFYIFVTDYLDSNLVHVGRHYFFVVVSPQKPTLHEAKLPSWLTFSHGDSLITWFCTKTKLLSTWLDIFFYRARCVACKFVIFGPLLWNFCPNCATPQFSIQKHQ